MKILKKENWWIWLLLTLFSSGSSTLVLGALLDVYRKNAWYRKWYYWVLGIPFIFPLLIIVSIFYLEIMCDYSNYWLDSCYYNVYLYTSRYNISFIYRKWRKIY